MHLTQVAVDSRDTEIDGVAATQIPWLQILYSGDCRITGLLLVLSLVCGGTATGGPMWALPTQK